MVDFLKLASITEFVFLHASISELKYPIMLVILYFTALFMNAAIFY